MQDIKERGTGVFHDRCCAGLELFFIDGDDGQLQGPTWSGPSCFFSFIRYSVGALHLH